MANKHVKRCSSSAVIKILKPQENTPAHLREWLELKSVTIPNIGKDAEELEPSTLEDTLLVEMENGISLWKTVWLYF